MKKILTIIALTVMLVGCSSQGAKDSVKDGVAATERGAKKAGRKTINGTKKAGHWTKEKTYGKVRRDESKNAESYEFYYAE